jgi:hypothetical protein
MMNPASLEAGSAIGRVYAPRLGESMPRREPQEQARRAYAARKLNRAKSNVNTGVALEPKVLGSDGV